MFIRKLDSLDTGYWRKNWLEPHRMGYEKPGDIILDGDEVEVKDTTHKRLSSGR